MYVHQKSYSKNHIKEAPLCRPVSQQAAMLYHLSHQGSNTGVISDNPLSSLCFSPFPKTVGKFLPVSLCVKLLIYLTFQSIP